MLWAILWFLIINLIQKSKNNGIKLRLTLQRYLFIFTIVILAGDANVGKTHIVYRFIKNGSEHYKNMAPTVGVEFSSKMVTLSGDKRIKVQIWDTGKIYVYYSWPITIQSYHISVKYSKYSVIIEKPKEHSLYMI